MARARDLERRLEHLVEGLAGRVFRGRLHPSELGARLIREADLAVFEQEHGPTAPNLFAFRAHPREVGEPSDRRRLERDLAELLEATARDRGWRLEGPAEVTIEGDDRLPPGTVECHGEVRPGRLPAWGHLEEVRGPRRLALRHNRILLGRSSQMDLSLPDPEISRRHALIWREGDQVWVADLGSSNGTFVDGARISEPALLHPASTVTFGASRFSLPPG